MKLSIKTYIAIAVLFFVAILTLKITGFDEVTKYLIPAFVAYVLVNVILFYKPFSGYNWFLCLAFVFVCIGDFINNLAPSLTALFIGAFCCTHICLTIYYLNDNKFKKKDILYLLLVLVVSTIIFMTIRNDIPKGSLYFVFMGYLLILSTMLWRAICYVNSKNTLSRKVLIITGSLLFYITDVCVGSNIIYDTKTLVIITWICYPPALVMLSLMNTVIQTQSVLQK